MRICQANPLPNYRLELRFDSGDVGTVDLSALAGRGVFAEWLRPGVFEQVEVTPEGAVAWPGEVDLCPDALYLQMTNQRAEDLFPRIHGRLTNA